MPPSSPVVVGIPVKDEAERVGDCLRALASQRGAAVDAVVLLLNDCTDDTAAIARGLAPALPFATVVVEAAMPADTAGAGTARRLAMARAAALGGAGATLLTTDADGRVAPDWLAGNLRALRRGADAVAGRAEIDPAEALLVPAALHEADARECAYAALLDEIASRLDPDPADPWPRHCEHSGASIAVRAAAFRRAGGIPPMALGEDRAFFDALRRVDARVRHAPEVRVTVSGRIHGRARGGMADTMRRRMTAPDRMLDDALERVVDAARRAGLRRRLRQAWSAVDRGTSTLPVFARALRLDPLRLAAAMAAEHFGTAWAAVEAESPVLVRRPVPVEALAAETAAATVLLRRLRDADQADSTSSRYSASRRASAGRSVGAVASMNNSAASSPETG